MSGPFDAGMLWRGHAVTHVQNWSIHRLLQVTSGVYECLLIVLCLHEGLKLRERHCLAKGDSSPPANNCCSLIYQDQHKKVRWRLNRS